MNISTKNLETKKKNYPTIKNNRKIIKIYLALFPVKIVNKN